MNKTVIFVLSFSAISAFAQDSVWDALDKRQKDLKEVVVKPGTTVIPEADKKEAIPGSKKAVCQGDKQESLPLSFVSRLFQEAPAKINIAHDPSRGTLKLTTGGMVDNCSPLIKWNLEKVASGDKVSYLVEAKFQKGQNCKVEAGVEKCEYTFTEKVGIESKDKKIFVEPNHRGLEACLKETGVMSANGINENAIVATKNIEEFSGVKESGDLIFVSTGKPLSNMKPKYSTEYLKEEGCTKYENIADKAIRLVSAEEEAAVAREAEAAKLIKDCTVNDYYKLTEFIDKYEAYESDMVKVRNNLISEAAVKAAKNISEGKYTEEDLKIIADFERYIVDPKIDIARDIYGQMSELEGDAKKAKQEELKLALAEITKLNSAPYFTAANVEKLIKDGKFDEAEQINSMKLMLQHHSKLGSTVNKVLQTPELAMVQVARSKMEFQAALSTQKEEYAIRTGQESGYYDAYAKLSERITSDMQTVRDNVNKNIQIEIACMTNSQQAKQICNQAGGKFCYAGYFRNANKCIQQGQEEIQYLQEWGKHTLEALAKKSKEAQEKAEHYKKLEDEGSRYVASQNGEEAPATTTEVTDPLAPPRRPTTADAGSNTFDFNVPQGQGGDQQAQQMYMQQMMMQQQQYNPWAQYSGQSQQFPMANNNFMGQGNFQWNSGYNMNGMSGMGMMGMNGMAGSFNYNSGVQGMQQPYGQYGQQGMYGQYGMGMQQQGYWNQPYQAYGNYNMYGSMGY